MASFDELGAGELELLGYDPGRNALGPIDDFDNLEARLVEFGNGTLKFELPFESRILALNYGPKNGTTQTAYDWALSEYGFDVRYRGAQFFSDSDGCVAVTCDDEDTVEGAHALDEIPVDVAVECWTWLQWFLSGRVIMTDDGDRFAPSAGKADDVLRAVLRANMLAPPTGNEPSEYATLSIDREDFGSHTIAIGADTASHPTTVTHRWDHGRPLWDSVVEFCRLYNLKLTGSWSGTTYTIDVAYPATGGDLTGSVKFSRARGNLFRFGRRVDRGATSNVAETKGQGRRAGQVREYAIEQAPIDDVGLRETSEPVRSANSADAQINSDWIIAQVGGAETSYRATLGEVDGQVWGDFDMSDKVLIDDERRDITVQDFITELILTMQNPGPPELQANTGRQPVNKDQQLSRSGGGGGGSRRGGGPPKGSDGEPVTDPDDILSFKTVVTDEGSDIVADQANDTLEIIGSDVDTPPNIITDADTANDQVLVRFELGAPGALSDPQIAGYSQIIVNGAPAPRYLAVYRDGVS